MRKKKKAPRPLRPDEKYNNITVSRFISQVMRQGKKSLAQRIVYKTFNQLGQEPLKMFEQALANVSPKMELISRRIGGANYQIPKEVPLERRLTLAMRWIVEAARKKKGRSMAEKLVDELKQAASNTGEAVKRKENLHRMAEANRAFAHFA